MSDLISMVKNKNIDINELWFETTPIYKIVILSILTFGFYDIVLLYNYWKVFKKRFGYAISPSCRAIFCGIYCFSLFPKLDKYIKTFNIPSFPPIWLAIFFIFLSALYRLPNPYSILNSFTFVIFIIIQNRLNFINEQHFPNAKQNNWSLANTLWTIPCSILFFIYLIGTFANK